ncbi:hypothetical protein [Kitasatospora nipponensis]
MTEIAQTADGRLPLAFLTDRTDRGANAPVLHAMAVSLAPTERVDFQDPAACLRALRRLGATAVTTFLPRLAPLAAGLHSRLADGVASGPDQPQGPWPVEGPWRASGPGGRAAGHPTPTDRPDNVERATGQPAGYSADPPADLMSVEMLRNSGARWGSRLAFVTDRPCPVGPGRESGLLAPSSRCPDLTDRASAAAAQAVSRRPASGGAFRATARLTADGPELLDVTGTLGPLVARAARFGAGEDLTWLALACAARLPDVPLPEQLTWRRCVAALLLPPPPGAHTVVSAPSRRHLLRLRNVLTVDQLSCAGDRVADWAGAPGGSVATVWLAADDHQTLRRRFVDTAALLNEAFAFADVSGAPVRDGRWLRSLTSADPSHGHADRGPTSRHVSSAEPNRAR